MKTSPLLLVVLCACGDPIADASLSVVISVEDISPGSAPASGGTELTIIGKNFGRDAQVTIGGRAPAAVEWKSAERLKVITASMTPGRQQVVVLSGGQRAQGPAPLIVRLEDLRLNDRSSLKLAEPSDIIGSGDADGDGLDDLIIMRPNARILLNTNGGMEFSREYEVAPDAWAIWNIFDLNRDGRIDLIGDYGKVYLSGPDLSFESAKAFEASTVGTTRQVAAGHFDGTETVSLVVVTDGAPLRLVELNASGHFLREHEIPETARRYDGAAVVVGDFDGDHRDDLAVLDSREALIDVRVGPELKSKDILTLPRPVDRMAAGDVDNDGKPDIVAVGGASFFFRGMGDGTYEPAVEFENPSSLPLFVGGAGGVGPQPQILGGSGGLLYMVLIFLDLPVWYYLPSDASYLVTGNFDGDGYLDGVGLGEDEYVITYGTYHGIFERGWGLVAPESGPPKDGSQGRLWPSLFTPSHLRSERELLVASGRSLSTISVIGGTPTLRPLLLDAIPEGDVLGAVAACDANGDGHEDAIVYSVQPAASFGESGRAYLRFFYGDGVGVTAGETLELAEPAEFDPRDRLLAVDLDGDGRCEPVVVTPAYPCQPPEECAPWTTVAFEHQGATLVRRELPFGRGAARSADLDRDGDIDFYYVKRDLARQSLGELAVFLNDGHGSFTQSSVALPIPKPGTSELLPIIDLQIAPGADGALELWAILQPAVDGLAPPSYYLAHAAFQLQGGLSALRYSPERKWATPYLWFKRGEVNGDGQADIVVFGDQKGATLYTTDSRGELLPAATVLAPDERTRADPTIGFYDLDQDGLDEIQLSTEERPRTLRLLKPQRE